MVDGCADVGLSLAAPATAEVAVVSAVGAAHDGARWGAAAGGGAELTFGGPLWKGFPSGRYGPLAGIAELRAGPWVGITTRAHGLVVEVGPKVHLGALYHASWGTFDFRPAIGTGDFATGRSAVTSFTVAWGVRSEPRRYYDGGACVGQYGLYDITPPPSPAPVALTAVLRVFGTLRRAHDLGASEIVVGLEISPDWALPPYSWARLIGFRPY